MEFRIVKEKILPALNSLNSVIEKKQTIAVLANIMLEVNNQQLILIGTDNKIELRIELEIENTTTPGITTVSCYKIYDICKSLPNESEIIFKQQDNKLVITDGNSNFILGTLPADNFPKINVSEVLLEFELPQKILHDLLTDISSFMGIQDFRFYINGMLLEINFDFINFVASDGHRLAINSHKLDDIIETEVQIIIPRKTVIELSKILTKEGNAKVIIGSKHLEVMTGKQIMISKLIDGKYPNYERIIPTNVDKKVVFDKNLLKDTLNRMAIISSEHKKGVTIDLGSGIATIITTNNEKEIASEQIDIIYVGESKEISFNIYYLLDAINGITDDNIALLFENEKNSCVVKPAAREYPIYVINPVLL